jgi:hypothetical protein
MVKFDMIDINEDGDRGVEDARGWLQAIVEMVGRYNEAIESGDDEKLDAAELDFAGTPFNVEVRSGWYSPGADEDKTPFEYRIILTTGERVLQVVGVLSEEGEPETAKIEYQGWSRPWIAFAGMTEEQRSALLAFAQRFSFVE